MLLLQLVLPGVRAEIGREVAALSRGRNLLDVADHETSKHHVALAQSCTQGNIPLRKPQLPIVWSSAGRLDTGIIKP